MKCHETKDHGPLVECLSFQGYSLIAEEDPDPPVQPSTAQSFGRSRSFEQTLWGRVKPWDIMKRWSGWWFGTMELYDFPIILGIWECHTFPTDFHSIIFQRARSTRSTTSGDSCRGWDFRVELKRPYHDRKNETRLMVFSGYPLTKLTIVGYSCGKPKNKKPSPNSWEMGAIYIFQNWCFVALGLPQWDSQTYPEPFVGIGPTQLGILKSEAWKWGEFGNWRFKHPRLYDITDITKEFSDIKIW